jgi:hypothetical protein
MHNLYNELRNAENIESAKYIFLCDLEKLMEDNEHKPMLIDRVSKAAAQKRININNLLK